MKKVKIKKYETKLVTRGNFKLRCISCGENYKDFDEVFTGGKTKNGNKLFNYFFRGPNAGKQEKSKNEVKPIEYYETHSITVFDFKKKCKKFGKNYNKFERIYSGEKLKNNSKKYYYKDIGKN
ncbi:hypothetical protein [Fusobacterium sp. MFO224]|uniref:hypothetical protein n=1 Tax=Fusobacterium sp. MFO224 TaxID=3378070 RepID=UPI003853F9B5